MTHDQNPLQRWLWHHHAYPKEALRHLPGSITRPLDELEQHLDRYEGETGRRPKEIWIGFPCGCRLPAQAESRGQELYLRLAKLGGPGSNHVQEELLNMLGDSARPGSTPFWVQLLDLCRPREQFARKRQTYALAALALLVILEGDEEAKAALLAATRHEKPHVRGTALAYLLEALQQSKQPISKQSHALLLEQATRERDLTTRLRARWMMHQMGLAIPKSNPDGSYIFTVTYHRDHSIRLTVEVGARQTLKELHDAIQLGLEWDDDHLYSFYLGGTDLRSAALVFSRPWEDGEPPLASDMTLDAMGLLPKAAFGYLFDFGDRQEFAVVLQKVMARAELVSELPRVLKVEGTPPQQYGDVRSSTP